MKKLLLSLFVLTSLSCFSQVEKKEICAQPIDTISTSVVSNTEVYTEKLDVEITEHINGNGQKIIVKQYQNLLLIYKEEEK